jgi:hypothetical protein
VRLVLCEEGQQRFEGVLGREGHLWDPDIRVQDAGALDGLAAQLVCQRHRLEGRFLETDAE